MSEEDVAGPVKTPRVRRTPAERAQAELDSAVVRVKKLRERIDQLQNELHTVAREHETAVAYANWAGQHPDLAKSSA
jgi:uncharacterized protein YlxW (UPF0749 family)